MKKSRKEMIDYMLEFEREWYIQNKKEVLKEFGYDSEESYLIYMKDVFSHMSDQDLEDNYDSVTE